MWRVAGGGEWGLKGNALNPRVHSCTMARKEDNDMRCTFRAMRTAEGLRGRENSIIDSRVESSVRG